MNTKYISTIIALLSIVQLYGQSSDLSINGILTSGSGEPVDEALVELLDENGVVLQTATTANAGTYSFTDLSPGKPYYIRPAYSGNGLNGVSTLDIVMLRRHLIGEEALPNPLQLIGADYDQSGHLSARDIQLMARIILGQSLPDDDSWQFVATDWDFGQSDNPFYNIDQAGRKRIVLTDADATADFYLLKKGDANFTVLVN